MPDPVKKAPSDVYFMYSFEDVYAHMKKIEKRFVDTEKELRKINTRLDRIESMFGDMFKLDLEKLKERRDNLYDSLNDPISDSAKARINTDIVKIERLIDLDMKKRCPQCNTIQSRFGTGNFCHECGVQMKEGNSNGKNPKKES